MHNRIAQAALLAGTIHALLTASLAAEPVPLRFDLQTRDPQTDQVRHQTETVDSTKLAVVIIDPWNYHWCMTACERVTAMVPRWNRALEGARRLGLPIVWGPSDVAGTYAGYPQRERALALPLVPVPKHGELACRFTAPVGPCMCGPGIACKVNYGEEAMHPDLVLAETDYIASSTEEVYAILRRHGVTHVIYLGLHTNMCLFGKPGALRYMADAGLKCMLARDINDAFTHYSPGTGFTPDRGTAQTDADLERAGIPTVNLAEEWRKAGLWNDAWIVETVRIVPWGKPSRPYFMKRAVTVTLTAPWLENVQIRYTLDDAEPTAQSPLYEQPLELKQTTALRTAAFRGNERVSLTSSAYYVRLDPLPSPPDVYLDDLEYVLDSYAEISATHRAFFWVPQVGRSFDGKELRVRGRDYAKGLGFRAPSGVRYALKPEHERFVALAGIADNMLDEHNAARIALEPSVVFRVFVDGDLAAESPVLRISQEPWRFNVPIPAGSRWLSLACLDAGSRSLLDLGNWVDAGFVLREGSPGKRPSPAETAWDAIPVPGQWEQAPGGKYAGYDGVAWYRCFVKVPASWGGKDIALHVDRIDNYNTTYFNGTLVGEGDYEQDGWCRYRVPSSTVKPGAFNAIVICVEDYGGAGGLREESPVLYGGDEAIELKGNWEFRTGENPDLARWKPGVEPPAVARFETVVPAATVPRKAVIPK